MRRPACPARECEATSTLDAVRVTAVPMPAKAANAHISTVDDASTAIPSSATAYTAIPIRRMAREPESFGRVAKRDRSSAAVAKYDANTKPKASSDNPMSARS